MRPSPSPSCTRRPARPTDHCPRKPQCLSSPLERNIQLLITIFTAPSSPRPPPPGSTQGSLPPGGHLAARCPRRSTHVQGCAGPGFNPAPSGSLQRVPGLGVSLLDTHPHSSHTHTASECLSQSLQDASPPAGTVMPHMCEQLQNVSAFFCSVTLACWT